MNTRRMLLASIAAFPMLSSLAQTWVPTTASQTNWYCIACSADGSKVIAAGPMGLFTSPDAGGTWLLSTNNSQDWVHVASSADGNTLLAVGSSTAFTSTNFGATWTFSFPGGSPNTGAACSADGSKLFISSLTAMHGGGGIWSSTNSGVTWAWVDTPGWSTYWNTISCSADGMSLVSGENNNLTGGLRLRIYAAAAVSAVAGPIANWLSSACSSSAKCIYAGAESAFYVSTNFGTSWLTNTTFGMSSLACSADGRRAVGIRGYTSLYTSENFGVTWVSNTLRSDYLYSVASSADGHRLFAACSDGIYKLETTPTPVLQSSKAGSQILLSWTAPSVPLHLQESPDLANWSRTVLEPTFNYTNLQLQLSAATGQGRKFYRLTTAAP